MWQIRPPMWKRALWLLVPLLGLVELGAHWVDAHQAPTESDWSGAAADMRSLAADHPLIVVAPEWAEPWARHVLGDELMPLANVARADATPYERALEIGILGKHSPELAHWSVEREERHGKFLLRLLSNPRPAKIAFGFVDHLEPTHVRVTVGSRSCSWTERGRVTTGGLGGVPALEGRRFDCGGASTIAVTVIDDEHYRPRRCIWAPASYEGPLSLRFENVPLGTEIHGYTGAPYLLTRDASGPPTNIEVRVAGKPVGTHAQEDGAGWTPFSFATTPGSADVEIVITSQNTNNHMFCFYADAR